MSKSQVTTIDDDVDPALQETQPETAEKAPRAARAPRAAPAIERGNHDSTLSGKRVTVTIHPGPGEDGNFPVDAQLNGRLYRIPRGVPCEIPVEVMEILNNAITQEHRVESGQVVVRNMPRFPMQVIAA